ncbi:MAG: DUF664 domain-containing protein [Nocardioidaceae bacterium]|nr:DUF664 domain-containing protein [Nocardioidaceae bacterium]NUS51852.1 DUF664 domain-containing protein [Nocardioidaceae bacterium]
MTDDTTLDTRISEPSFTADEAEMLRFALARSRATFAWKVGGLDAEALHREHPPSSMTLGGLVKHLALVEDHTTSEKLAGTPMAGPWRRADFEADPDWEWHSGAQDRPEELYRLWREAVARTDAAIDRVLADVGPGGPAAFTTAEGEHPNVRRVLTDLHDEYARHVGHADLMREAIDGLVGEDPPQPGEEDR